MTEIDYIIEQVLGLTEKLGKKVGTGIYMKQLDSGRQVFSCKCPVCGTVHGGYRSFEEAKRNLKCREHHRKEIEKTKKEIEKVDEPKKQKNIFQNRMNKPAVIGEADETDDEGFEDDDVGWKDVTDLGPDRIAYVIDDGRERYPLTRDGLIGRQGYTMAQMTAQWTLIGMTFHHWSNTYTPWEEIRTRLERGERLVGYLFDNDYGTLRRWGKKVEVYKSSVGETQQEDQDVAAVLSGLDSKPGDVDKVVCENARPGQDFWHRYQRHADGSPVRVQASGKCLTWESKPNEFRLPVKYGLFQTFYITEHNADDFTTLRPGDRSDGQQP